MIRAEITGVDDIKARLQGLPDKLRAELVRTITEDAFSLQAHIVTDKLSGQVLHRRTGNLASSINTKIGGSATSVEGTVGTNVGYGRIHELGGTFRIPEHERRINRGGIQDSVLVRAHSATFPKRSFLASSLQDMSTRIKADLNAAVARGLQ